MAGECCFRRPSQVLLRYVKSLTAPVPSTAPVVCCNTGATRVSCPPDYAVTLCQSDAPINETCDRCSTAESKCAD